MTESPFVYSGFAVLVFSLGDDLIACLNKAMVFLTDVASSRGDKGKIILVILIRVMLRAKGEILQVDSQGLLNATTVKTEDLDTYDSDCDDLSNAQAVLMANISNYGSNVISEKAQRMKPTLYDGIVISKKHVAMPVIDNEETLILEEESRSNMSEKAKDPEVIGKKISHKPIDYEKLNRLTDDFGKRFTPQQELSAEQALWLRISNPTIESSFPPVRVEVPSEQPKKRATPNALTEGIGTRFSTLDYMNSSNSISEIVSRCSSPILRESSGSTVGKSNMIAIAGKG
nr:hypothetical protein [Tanacetum cinerariifolium]